jgi:hypothetical protein
MSGSYQRASTFCQASHYRQASAVLIVNGCCQAEEGTPALLA